jgi:hypothetical protein
MKSYTFPIFLLVAFGFSNCFSQAVQLSDDHLNKIIGINLNYSFIQDYGSKSKFNSFAFSNTFLKRRSQKYYLSQALRAEYNTDTRKEYPYYLFNRFGISSISQSLVRINKRNSTTLIGGGIKVAYYRGLKATDFNIPQNAVVSVQQPNGGAFTVPIIHPFENRPKKGFMVAGPHVSLNHFIPFSSLGVINLNLQYSYVFPQMSDFGCGIGVFLKLSEDTKNSHIIRI